MLCCFTTLIHFRDLHFGESFSSAVPVHDIENRWVCVLSFPTSSVLVALCCTEKRLKCGGRPMNASVSPFKHNHF